MLKFKAGRRRESWKKNCVAIGLAAGFMEPLESQSIHLIQAGISRLVAMFPDRNHSQSEVDRYNRRMRFEYETIRDFIVLHYNATQRDDSDYWNYLRTMKVSEYLADKIAVFRDHGRIFREDDELFHDTSWFAVMMGQGIRPKRHDPLVDAMDRAELKRRLDGVRRVIRKSVDWMPHHHDFIAQHCAADPVQFQRSAGEAGSATAATITGARHHG